MKKFTLFLLPVVVTGASLLQIANSQAKPAQNPFRGDPEAALAGQKLFERECSGCHGQNGRGNGRGRTPVLANQLIKEADPGSLFWILRNGSASHRMPSFSHLPEEQRWQIIAFLQR